MMKVKKISFNYFSVLFLLITSCTGPQENTIVKEAEATAKNEAAFTATLQKHLDAVSRKDLPTLKSTLSPTGTMHLILPNAKIENTVDYFVEMHREWFQDTAWTFSTKILNTIVEDSLGFAITEILYQEPERNGKPYFNRMAVSYALQKSGGNWYVISDHASTIERTVE